MICNELGGGARPARQITLRGLLTVAFPVAGAAPLVKRQDLPRQRVIDAVQTPPRLQPAIDGNWGVVVLMHDIHVPRSTCLFVVLIFHIRTLTPRTSDPRVDLSPELISYALCRFRPCVLADTIDDGGWLPFDHDVAERRVVLCDVADRHSSSDLDSWLAPASRSPRSLDFRFIDVVRLPNRGMGIATVRPMSYFRTPQLDDVILAGREDILKKT